MEKPYRSGGYNKNAQFRRHNQLLQKPKLAIAHKNSKLALPGQTENQQKSRDRPARPTKSAQHQLSGRVIIVLPILTSLGNWQC
jgi:hypothetical protein